MSLYSQGWERRERRIGFPFCRGETRIEDPDERVGRDWGMGWVTLGRVGVIGGRGSRSCGTGWTIRGFDVVVEGGEMEGREGSTAAKAARKSGSAPNSSSSDMAGGGVGVDGFDAKVGWRDARLRISMCQEKADSVG